MPIGSKRWWANLLTMLSTGTPYWSARLMAVPSESIRPPMVEPSFAMVMKSSPGLPSS